MINALIKQQTFTYGILCGNKDKAIRTMYINYKGHRIFAFSDTHGMHRRLSIPDGADIMVCASDDTIFSATYTRMAESKRRAAERHSVTCHVSWN